MSMKNPPAFPRIPITPPDRAEEFEGMTLRDYFAAKAMQSYIHLDHYAATKEAVASASFAVADAMLEERAKQ